MLNSSTHLFVRLSLILFFYIFFFVFKRKKKRKELCDLMTVINYFEEHLLNNFLLTKIFRKCKCGILFNMLYILTASGMISLTFTNSFFSATPKRQQNLCLPQFLKMSKQLVIHKPKEFKFTTQCSGAQ